MLVSIITVCRNASATIDRTLASVAKQTHADIQYIVIDGASTDDTKEIIARYSESIDEFVSEEDSGIFNAMNKGIKRARGELIYFLNADDYFCDATVIADVVRFVEEHPEGCVYYGGIEVRIAGKAPIEHMPAPPELAGETMVCGSLPHQGTFARRSVFERLGGFNETYRIHADYDWFVRVIADQDTVLLRMPRIIASFAMGATSSNLQAGQPEAYAIQNSAEYYQTEWWLRRRLELFQQELLHCRIENARLSAELAGRVASSPPRTFLAKSTLLKSLKRFVSS
jgi:glycosyltransferase involved in cell wall biosynthesis